MKHRFSPELEYKLEKSGWYAGRETDAELKLLHFPMHKAGERFLTEFGGLTIGSQLFCNAYYVNAHYEHHERLAVLSGLPNLLPVAATWYWGEGSLWLDATGRAYLTDDYELAFVGKTVEEALELLILGKEIPAHYRRWDLPPREM
ncbi:SUKH-3 immunity protein of toxin-antitoxin system [Roseimicrobium gellanilyticum]|uniref:SUKH-3 immunity protein of toxin-antitoxin system n=1 Tax=Roseimicrobium gellanilyticum TaxID=748857 RepID=A0A366HPC1_9BACT|nr:SUKH-3 domain-containing protein [Roseimicrobium gellanilyticum]RBP45360.1 SUKH-3 immunity protein of toxin-antitoxin system [Roseimicrobium gellanilyticum]